MLTTLNTATTILLYLAKKCPCGERKAVILTVTSHYTRYYFTVYTCTHSQTLNRLQFSRCLPFQYKWQYNTSEPPMGSRRETNVLHYGNIVGGCLLRHISFLCPLFKPLTPEHQLHKLIALIIERISFSFFYPCKGQGYHQQILCLKMPMICAQGSTTRFLICWTLFKSDAWFGEFPDCKMYPPHAYILIFCWQGGVCEAAGPRAMSLLNQTGKHKTPPQTPHNLHTVPSREQSLSL